MACCVAFVFQLWLLWFFVWIICATISSCETPLHYEWVYWKKYLKLSEISLRGEKWVRTEMNRLCALDTLSIILWKCTSTVQLCTSLCSSELWISTETFFDLIFWALQPNTKSMESMTLDFPLPFGPIMQEKRWKGK